MQEQSVFSKYFKSSEEVISMFLGLVIVLVMVGLVVNYFQKRRGSVELSGLINTQTKVANETSGDGKMLPGPEKISGTYKVKSNDSLWKIAVANYGDGYAWTKIAKANNLKNPGVLVTNQELVLPVVEKQTVTEQKTTVTKGAVDEKVSTPKSHVVVRNDSLWKIAVANYGDGYAWTKIWNKNKSKLANPNSLEIGMTLMLE